MVDLHNNPDAAADMAVNAVLKYLRECNPADKPAWIDKVFEAVKQRAK